MDIWDAEAGKTDCASFQAGRMADFVYPLDNRSGSSKDRSCHEDERKDRLEEVHDGCLDWEDKPCLIDSELNCLDEWMVPVTVDNNSFIAVDEVHFHCHCILRLLERIRHEFGDVGSDGPKPRRIFLLLQSGP